MNQISSLTEKRPSITEKELTPIVLNQLQNTKKHKVGMKDNDKQTYKQTNTTNKYNKQMQQTILIIFSM